MDSGSFEHRIRDCVGLSNELYGNLNIHRHCNLFLTRRVCWLFSVDKDKDTELFINFLLLRDLFKRLSENKGFVQPEYGDKSGGCVIKCGLPSCCDR